MGDWAQWKGSEQDHTYTRIMVKSESSEGALLDELLNWGVMPKTKVKTEPITPPATPPPMIPVTVPRQVTPPSRPLPREVRGKERAGTAPTVCRRKRKLLRSLYFGLGLCIISLVLLFLQTVPRYNGIRPQFNFIFVSDLNAADEGEYTKPKYSCPSNLRPGLSEDILCMKKKTFLKNFKNPCWYEYKRDTNETRRVLRCLPYFHIFGVCKSGTTDLFFRLSRHPNIIENYGLLQKETWYWSWRRYGFTTKNKTKVRLDDGFLNLFNTWRIGDTKLSMDNWSNNYSDVITGHGDPMDFWDHRFWRMIPQNDPSASKPDYMTPHLIQHLNPNVKLILMLREPAERLYSHYYHAGYGHTADEFHNDVIAALQVIGQCAADFSYRTCLYGRNISKHMNIPLTASLYYIHLKEWLDVFPREQIFILRNEDYHRDPKYTLLQLFKFLDAGDISSYLLNHIINLPKQYETRRKVFQGSMLNETWEILEDFFEIPNRKLAAMLNDDRYLWKDTTFKFRPKKIRKGREHAGDQLHYLRNYYNRKKKQPPHQLTSVIDQLIAKSKSFEEWMDMVWKLQRKRLQGMKQQHEDRLHQEYSIQKQQAEVLHAKNEKLKSLSMNMSVPHGISIQRNGNTTSTAKTQRPKRRKRHRQKNFHINSDHIT